MAAVRLMIAIAGTRGLNPLCSTSESGEPPAPSAEPPMGPICHRSPWRARGEFLRGGTNSSNPSPSSGESANLRFLRRATARRLGEN
jgi:hypothetical protein